MAIQHTLLDTASLAPEAQKIFGSAPAKMMAARGMAPIADAAVLVAVLYQLSLDNDSKIRVAAVASAKELPDSVLSGGLSTPGVDPRVLDYFARQVMANEELIQLIVLNQSTADETIAMIAGRSGEKMIDLISQNEQRLLSHPEIISAMYTNRKARMSTVDRAVELAVRNKIKVPKIAAWDEVCKALLNSGKDNKTDEEKDAAFAKAAGVNLERTGEADDGEEDVSQSIRDLSIPMKIRLATLGNSFDRAFLVRDAMKMVAVAAIKAPGVTDGEAAKYANNASLADEVINYIAGRRDWTKLYSVKLSLVQNPKTSIPNSMRLLPHLRDKEIKTLARSKGVPSALVAQAKGLLLKRKGKN